MHPTIGMLSTTALEQSENIMNLISDVEELYRCMCALLCNIVCTRVRMCVWIGVMHVPYIHVTLSRYY